MFAKGKPIQPHLYCRREFSISIYSTIPYSAYLRQSQLVRNAGCIILRSSCVEHTKKILANFLLLIKGNRIGVFHAAATKNIKAAANSNIKPAFTKLFNL